MAKTKFYDVLTSVTDMATTRFSPILEENEESKSIMKEISAKFDKISDDYNGISYEVEVDENTTEIKVSFTCEMFETMKGDNTLGDIAIKARSIAFSKYEDDIIQIDFVFDGIWKSVRKRE